MWNEKYGRNFLKNKNINNQRIYSCSIFVCYDSHGFFSLKPLFCVQQMMWKYLLFTLIHVLIYDSWEEKAWKPKEPRQVSRHWDQPGLLSQPSSVSTHNLLSPLCRLSFSSSSQGFHNIFIYLVSCGNFAWQGVCYHAFWHSNPLSLWVLSWQRVLHNVKQLILICLHLVLCRDARAALQSYLIFKLSV